MGGAACYICSRLDLQTGACPDHRPFDWHWRWLIPTKLNPGLQKYCAREPTVLPLRRTCPFEGATKPPQFTMLSAFKRERSLRYQASIIVNTILTRPAEGWRKAPVESPTAIVSAYSPTSSMHAVTRSTKVVHHTSPGEEPPGASVESSKRRNTGSPAKSPIVESSCNAVSKNEQLQEFKHQVWERTWPRHGQRARVPIRANWEIRNVLKATL